MKRIKPVDEMTLDDLADIKRDIYKNYQAKKKERQPEVWEKEQELLKQLYGDKE